MVFVILFYICCLIDLSFDVRLCLIDVGMLLLMLLICVFGGFVWHLLVLVGWWVLLCLMCCLVIWISLATLCLFPRFGGVVMVWFW